MSTSLTPEDLGELVDSLLTGQLAPEQGDEHHNDTEIKFLNLIIKQGVNLTRPPSHLTKSQWLVNCVAAIEVICQRSPLILNEQTQDAEIIYIWLLNSLVQLLGSIDTELVNTVKQTIISLIYLISVDLKLAHHVDQTRDQLWEIFDKSSKNLTKPNNEEHLIYNLSLATNLFSLLSDVVIREKLDIDTENDTLFESFVRRAFYIITSMKTEKIDVVQSHLVSAAHNYALNDEFVDFTKLRFFIEVSHDLILTDGFIIMKTTQLSLAYCLLSTALKCEQCGLLSQLEYDLQIGELIELFGEDIEVLKDFKKSLNFIQLIIMKDFERVFDEIDNFENESLQILRLNCLKKFKTFNSQIELLNLLNFNSEKNYTHLIEWIVDVKNYLEENTPNNTSKYQLINSIGDFVCIVDGRFNNQLQFCELCQESNILKKTKQDRPSPPSSVSLALQLVEKYFITIDPNNEIILTMGCLMTISKIFTHYQPPKLSTKDPIFKFIYNSILSKSREVRLLSAKIIPLYLISQQNNKNQITDQLFSILIDLGVQDKEYVYEAVLFIWGQISILSEQDRLNLSIYKLIDYLGAQNSFNSSLAFHELQIIASAKEKTPWQLLAPYMPDLSLKIARQLFTKPSMGQNISDLVEVSLNSIFARTVQHIVPFVLTDYQHDILGEISRATSIDKPNLVAQNLQKSIAILLTNVPGINKNKIMNILTNASPSLKGYTFKDLIVLSVCIWEVLKIYSSQLSNKKLIIDSIYLILKEFDPNSPPADLNKVLMIYFEKHILGLAQKFSEAIHSIRGSEPYTEKLKAINAIELVVQISGPSLVSALPQICACFQAALEDEYLREATLRCWKIMIQNLQENHLVTLLDLSLAVVLQRWDDFDNDCKQEARNLLSEIFSKSEDFCFKHIHCFFSLSGNVDLLDIYKKIKNLMNNKNDKPHTLLSDIARRLGNDNRYVVKQALVDLSRFLVQYQHEFYSVYLTKPGFSTIVSALFGALLNILHKFKNNNDIQIQCSKCLGSIGALDPTKFEVEQKRDQMIVASNFEDLKEQIKFLIRLIDKYLVPAFWASEDPNKQLFLAFSMQELLKIIGLDSSKVDLNNLNPTSHEYLLWSQFSDTSKSTLTPLVSSKYTASASQYAPMKYPIYNTNLDHSKWLRQFTLDMLKRAQGKGSPIFTIISSLIKDHDLSFCSFILPYAALDMVLSDLDDHIVGTEIMTILSMNLNSVNSFVAENLKLCYDSIFSLLDYFRKWIFARKQMLKRKNIKRADPAIARVSQLLSSIPQELMAERSIQANSYERSILYMEQCYRSSVEKFDNTFYDTLQKMYARIDDFDALDGVLKKFSDKSLNERITELEYSDNWKLAQECFEALGEGDVEQIDSDSRLLVSLYDHELYDQTLEKLDSLLILEKKPLNKDWLNIGIESSMLSGRLDELRKWLNLLENSESFPDSNVMVNYHIGKSLVYWASNDDSGFHTSLDNAYLLLSSNLSGTVASLARNRSSLISLHGLNDLKEIHDSSTGFSFQSASALMDIRNKYTGSDFKPNWVIASMRKVSNQIANNEFNVNDIGKTWIESSKLARKHNRLDLATLSVMKSVKLRTQDSNIEFAKILWQQGDFQRGLKILQELKLNKDGKFTEKELAKIQLKYTKWLDQSNNSSSTKIIEEYTEAIKLNATWEKPYYALGKYYNKILDIKSATPNSIDKINPKDLSGDYERRTISYYLKSLHCGIKYLYEALPKVVTVWLDFAEHVAQVPEELSDTHKTALLHERRKNLNFIHEEITKSAEKLPKYLWYTVLSQLLSRLLHPNRSSSQLIIMIANIVLQEYPSQVMWFVLAQYRSTQTDRQKKAKKILDLFATDNSSNGESNAQFLQSSKKLFNQLILVSSKALPKVKGPLSLKHDFEFDTGALPAPLVVPVKTNFDITLPTSTSTLKNHSAFPASSRVTISKFDNRVDVLSSMQQPRHLYLRGSNGMTYSILCKPNDDLRKDAKLMQFTSMVDHLLHKDYESEKRKLLIKTYAVIPLNENHGIIEWVDHSRPMRDIIKTHYANINLTLDVPHIRKILDKDCEVEEKAHLFQKQILDKYPPVLYLWFNENFPDPISWYDARNNYTRTTAVMSMVGYMLGLGDRHGENLLFNERDGGILHVDFDCLFEKGLELTVPERVPFRLTHNMVDAFGITGVEGTFRKSCEVTLSLLRSHETTLMNILESFIHDPIMDWSQKRKTKTTPQKALSTIRRKIRGILDKEGLPVSVQGQTEFLIQQATSLENLCQMYIGWMAFW